MGRIVEIAGLDASGKSTLALHFMAEVQKMGGIVILLETESGIDSSRARKLGVTEANLIIINPLTLEQGFEMAVKAVEEVRSRNLDPRIPIAIVWDSVAATTTQSEDAHKFDESGMAPHARALAKAFRKLMFFLPRNNVILLLVNQMKGTMKQYGPDVESFGGKAIRFHASIRIEIKRGPKSKTIKDDTGKPISLPGYIRIIKNKLGTPDREANVLLNFTRGFDKYMDLFEVSKAVGLIKGRGNKLFFKDFLVPGIPQNDALKKMGEAPVNLRKMKDFVWKRFGGPNHYRTYLRDKMLLSGKLKPYGSDKLIKAWEHDLKARGIKLDEED